MFIKLAAVAIGCSSNLSSNVDIENMLINTSNIVSIYHATETLNGEGFFSKAVNSEKDVMVISNDIYISCKNRHEFFE